MNKLRVVIADDHQLVIEGYKSVLLLDDVNIVAEFNRGDDLLEWLKINSNDADLLLLDIEMPGMKGIDVLRYIRLHNIEMNTIIISAYSTQNYINDVADLGCKGFLLKETVHLEFEEAVRVVSQGGVFFSKSLEAPELNEELELSLILENELSDRERELLPMLEDLSYTEISKETELSVNTIKTYVRRMKEKLGIKTKVGLVKWFYNKK
ncbi:response regulator transcription factor [Tenacibaculum sp. 190524A02b]|uniref:response regulator transcription factor n=1 Tax=Tenacibaculum vairaonense TaxID=3137860 RepID=UPI0032B1E359